MVLTRVRVRPENKEDEVSGVEKRKRREEWFQSTNSATGQKIKKWGLV